MSMMNRIQQALIIGEEIAGVVVMYLGLCQNVLHHKIE